MLQPKYCKLHLIYLIRNKPPRQTASPDFSGKFGEIFAIVSFSVPYSSLEFIIFLIYHGAVARFSSQRSAGQTRKTAGGALKVRQTIFSVAKDRKRAAMLALGLLAVLLIVSCGPHSAGASVEPDVGVPDIMVTPDVEIFLAAADQEMSEGDAAAALAAVAHGLVRHPGDPALLARQADILATQPAFRTQALELYQRLLAAHPDDLGLKVKLARIWLALHQPFKAETLFLEVVARDPGNFDANLGLGRIYLATVFYTMATRHFALARASRPESREALEGWWQASSLITTQFQTMANTFEDAEGFRRNSLWSGFWQYLTPRLRLGSGYGYLEYHSGFAPFRRNRDGQDLHRHVVPLVLQFRPATRVYLEAGGAFNDYGRWGQSGTARAAAYWQAARGTGLSLAYSYYDVIEFFGPFRGPWGLFFDDFAGYGRYRYNIANPIGLWSQSFFGASASNTLAVTRQLRAHDIIPWMYQSLGERVMLVGSGDVSFYSDGNFRQIWSPTLQFRLLQDPLLKFKYSFYYGDYLYSSQQITPPGAAPAYLAFRHLKYHYWGFVLEKNWGSRFKLALETNLNYNQMSNSPGFNSLVEIDYLLTHHVSARLVGFYANAVTQGSASYQVRSALATLSYRF
jgi:tetratricopeptide (TPR) repeat protein